MSLASLAIRINVFKSKLVFGFCWVRVSVYIASANRAHVKFGRRFRHVKFGRPGGRYFPTTTAVSFFLLEVYI